MSHPAYALASGQSAGLLERRAEALIPEFQQPEGFDYTKRYAPPTYEPKTVGVAVTVAAMVELSNSALRTPCSSKYIVDVTISEMQTTQMVQTHFANKLADSMESAVSIELDIHGYEVRRRQHNSRRGDLPHWVQAAAPDRAAAYTQALYGEAAPYNLPVLSGSLSSDASPDSSLDTIPKNRRGHRAAPETAATAPLSAAASPRSIGAINGCSVGEPPSVHCAAAKSALNAEVPHQAPSPRGKSPLIPHITIQPRSVPSISQYQLSMRDCLATAQQYGCPQRETYEAYGNPKTITVSNDAHMHKIANYASISTISCAQRALVLHGPLGIVFPVYNYGAQPWVPCGQASLGFHAMLVLGYDDMGFKLRNSWGTEWNNGGYTHFPYSDWGMQTECWTKIVTNAVPPISGPVKSSSSGRLKKFVRQLSNKGSPRSTASTPRDTSRDPTPRSTSSTPRGSSSRIASPRDPMLHRPASDSAMRGYAEQTSPRGASGEPRGASSEPLARKQASDASSDARVLH